MPPHTFNLSQSFLKQIRKKIAFVVLFAFVISPINTPAYAQLSSDSQIPWMPKPGVMIQLSPEFTPAFLKGITIHPENALMFDFIIQRGDKSLSDQQKQEEYKKLIKYFLASLAIPDDDQWVNLSPYEKNRIIKDDFGKTEMGRDLLAQDYILKQITASLIYPEDNLGKKFWDKVYSKAQQQFGTTDIPVNTFNKVWIVPDDALIYEKGNTAYVLKNHLKVMLEEDYLSLSKHAGITDAPPDQGKDINKIGSQVVREIVLPALEQEVNEGKNFSPLRQVYSGMILAAWYKRVLKESLLGKIYANKAKVKGVDSNPKNNEEIYHRYLRAYKKGVFNYIREDIDKYTNETIPRKYFSGGTTQQYDNSQAPGYLKETKDSTVGDSAMNTDASTDGGQDIVIAKAAELPEVAPRRQDEDLVGVEKFVDIDGKLKDRFVDRTVNPIMNVQQNAGIRHNMETMDQEKVAQVRQTALDKFREVLNSVPGEERVALAQALSFIDSTGKASLNHVYDFALRRIFNKYLHYDDFEATHHETTRNQVTALYQLAALDLVLGGATSGSSSEKTEVKSLRRALQNSRVGVVLEMLFVLYPKTKLPMFNIDVGFDDGTIYEGLYQLSTKFPSVDDFINDLERRVLGADINQGQEGWMDTLINDANKRSQWLQSVFDIALPLEGSGKRLDEFFAKSVHQQSLSLDLPRALDVFTPAIKNALEIRSGATSAAVLKRQEEWVSQFNNNNRQDLLRGINTGFHLDSEGAMVENERNLPSFSQIFWYSRLGILLDVLKDLKTGVDLDLFHEKLFEMAKQYTTYDDFVKALEQKIIGEDSSLNMKDWQIALINDPVKRMRWLQELFNIAVSTETEDQRAEAVNKFDSLRKPVSVWPEAAEMARNPEVLRKGLPSRSSPWASNNLRINNGFWSLGPEKALGLVSRGIRGALDKSLTDEGFAAPEREQFVKLGLSFLPLSSSELPYGGVGWSNGITAFFIKDRLNIASTEEVQQLKSQMGREWTTFLTDKDEVVVKNSASWDALKYLFLSKAVFENNYDRLSALNLLGRVIVIDSKDDTVEYFMGDNQEKKTSLKKEVLSEFDNKWGEDLRWQMASRVVMTDVFKNQYRQSLVDGKSREERIIEAASAMGHKEFTPEQIAEELHEDLDIVMDVLVDSQAYSLRATHINYNGQRTAVLVAKPQEAPVLSWDDMTRELSPNEMKQYQNAKDEYAQHRASVKLFEVYPGRRIGRNGEADRALIVNHQTKGINAPGGIDLNAANLNLQIKRDGKGVPLPIIQQDLENIKIDGLVPVIIAIKPMSAAPGMPEVQVSGVQ